MKVSTASLIALCALSAGACASAPAPRVTESGCGQSETLATRRADLVRQRDRAQVDVQEATRRQSEERLAAKTGAATSETGSPPPAPSRPASLEKSSISSSSAEVARLDREIALIDGSAKSLPAADACRAAGVL